MVFEELERETFLVSCGRGLPRASSTTRQAQHADPLDRSQRQILYANGHFTSLTLEGGPAAQNADTQSLSA